MSDKAINEISRDFVAVLAGVLTAIITASILVPVVNLFASNQFQLTLFSQSVAEAWKEDLVVRLTLFGWLFVASVAGGLICTLIASNRDMILVLISSLVSIALVFILSGGEVVNRNHMIISVLIILGIPIGNVIGASIGWRLKKRK